jgi:hypothetical protein
MAQPPPAGVTSSDYQVWKQNTGMDTARYLVNPGYVKSATDKSAGNLAHVRPHLVCGSKFFVFPVGVEGFNASGQAMLGLHHYLGASVVAAKQMHREEGRIELTGVFPGITAQQNMVQCRDLLRSQAPAVGMSFYAEGVFETVQYVLPESWSFTHDEGDRTHSINYTITFVRIGTGPKISDPAGKAPPPQPGVKSNPKGKGRIFIVRAGVRTLRQISKVVYGNPDKWPRLADLNKNTVFYTSFGSYQLPLVIWPIGTKFKY